MMADLFETLFRLALLMSLPLALMVALLSGVVLGGALGAIGAGLLLSRPGRRNFGVPPRGDGP